MLRATLMTLALCSLLVPGARAADADSPASLPRYRLSAGLKLVYESHSERKGTSRLYVKVQRFAGWKMVECWLILITVKFVREISQKCYLHRGLNKNLHKLEKGPLEFESVL